MKFLFEVGEKEKHKVGYHFGKWWGKVHLSVDGRIVRKQNIMFYNSILLVIGLLPIIFSGTLIPFACFLFLVTLNQLLFVVIFLLLFLAFGIQIICAFISILWWTKLGRQKLVVGETEKHDVEIRILMKPFGAFRKKEVEVLVDGEFLQAQ